MRWSSLAAHRAPASLSTWTRNAQLGAPGPIALEKDREPFGLPRDPDRRGRRAFAPPPPGYLDFGPRPASADRPPRPAPGPRWRQRSVTAPLLSLLRSAPCQEEAAPLHPKGQGPRPSAGGARARGDPRRGRGPGGGEEEGRWPGQCVGGEGSRTAAATASSPRPPQLFVQPREGPVPQPLQVLLRTLPGRTRRGVGGRLPKAARSPRRGSKLSGAASPTAIFPGKRPRRRLRRRSRHLLPLLRDVPLSRGSPHHLPSISFSTSKASNCTGTPGSSSSCYAASSIQCPPLPSSPPTNCR